MRMHKISFHTFFSGNEIEKSTLHSYSYSNFEAVMFSSKKDFVEQKTKHLLTRSGILNFCAVAMSLHDLGYRPLVSDCLSLGFLSVLFLIF